MNTIGKKLICASIMLAAQFPAWAEDVDIELTPEVVTVEPDTVSDVVSESEITDFSGDNSESPEESNEALLQAFVDALATELEVTQEQLSQIHLRLVRANTEFAQYKKDVQKRLIARTALCTVAGAFLGVAGTYLYQLW